MGKKSKKSVEVEPTVEAAVDEVVKDKSKKKKRKGEDAASEQAIEVVEVAPEAAKKKKEKKVKKDKFKKQEPKEDEAPQPEAKSEKKKKKKKKTDNDDSDEAAPVEVKSEKKKKKKEKKRKQTEESEEADADEDKPAQPAAKKVKFNTPAPPAKDESDGGARGPTDGGVSDGGYSSGGAKKQGTAANAFQRVKADEWLGKKGSWDNSYVGTFGENGWGFKAEMVLGKVRGKDFRHEKTKKKRGSYKGGAIDTGAVCSYKFESDDE